MATDGMRTLIDAVYEDKEMREALLDINRFKQTIISKFSREDLDVLEEAGFEFSNNFITQRRNELKTFLLTHPECMSGDFETLMDKIMYYTAKQGTKLKDQKKKRLQRVKQLAKENIKRVKKSKSKPKPKAPIEEEEEEEEEESESK